MKKIYISLFVLIVILIIGIYIFNISNLVIIGPFNESKNATRFANVWDILDLLLVPIFLIIAAGVLTNQEKIIDRNAQIEKTNQDLFNLFFEKMSELILKYELADNNTVKQTTRNLARNWSLLAFRQLDNKRKANILQFLFEEKLIEKQPIVNLNGAKINDAELSSIVLENAEIKGAWFTNVSFKGANLRSADFCGSEFTKADFRNAILDKTNLSFTILTNANLENVELRNTDLTWAKLEGASIKGVKINEDQLKTISISKQQRKYLENKLMNIQKKGGNK